MSPPPPRVAVVGHTEWAVFARVPRLPRAGEVVHASDAWEGPGGGGAVAAAQLARLAGTCAFFTAVGSDAFGSRTVAGLSEEGVEVLEARRALAHRRVLVHVDPDGERALTVLGPRMPPSAADALPWATLAACSAVYVTSGDVGALRAARAARVLVATARVGPVLVAAGVAIDVLVRSAGDPGEQLDPASLSPPPRVVVSTEGAAGGRWEAAGGGGGGRYAAAPLPGPPVDAYGCGDSFAAGLTYALASGKELEAALASGARCGAACRAGRGPFGPVGRISSR